jgi:hypothetical protein
VFQLARLLGRQAARQHVQNRSRGLGHIWIAVWIVIVAALVAVALPFIR